MEQNLQLSPENDAKSTLTKRANIEEMSYIYLRDITLKAGKDRIAQTRETMQRGFVPHGRNVVPYALRTPVNWDDCPFPGDRNWTAQLHMWRWADAPILALNDISSDKERNLVMNWLVCMMEDWLKAVNRSEIGFANLWEGQISGLRAQKIAYLAQLRPSSDRAALSLTPHHRLVIRELAALHTLRLMANRDRILHNHLIDESHGLMALARVTEDPKIRSRIESEAVHWISTLSNHQFNSDGVCIEDAVEYHSYNILRLEKALKTGWYPQNLLDQLRKPKLTLEQWRMPDGRIPSIGDSNLKRSRGPFGNLAEKGPENIEVFANSGYAVIRSRETPPESSSYLFVMAACNSGIHKHADDLSIIWTESGHDILVDPGKYAYHKDEWRPFFNGPSAHNTMTVDGLPFRALYRTPVSPMMKVINHFNGSFIALGVVESSFGEWQRRFDYKPGRELLITDKVILNEAKSIQLWWQMGEANLVANAQEKIVVQTESGIKILITVMSEGPQVRTTAHSGEMEPSKLGWLSYSYGERSKGLTLKSTVRASLGTVITTRFVLQNE